jgi:hypothetical protein
MNVLLCIGRNTLVIFHNTFLQLAYIHYSLRPWRWEIACSSKWVISAIKTTPHTNQEYHHLCVYVCTSSAFQLLKRWVTFHKQLPEHYANSWYPISAICKFLQSLKSTWLVFEAEKNRGIYFWTLYLFIGKNIDIMVQILHSVNQQHVGRVNISFNPRCDVDD